MNNWKQTQFKQIIVLHLTQPFITWWTVFWDPDESLFDITVLLIKMAKVEFKSLFYFLEMTQYVLSHRCMRHSPERAAFRAILALTTLISRMQPFFYLLYFHSAEKPWSKVLENSTSTTYFIYEKAEYDFSYCITKGLRTWKKKV